jgi:acetyl esterase/lipase
MAPLKAARLLAELLLANGVKMVYHELPQVDHAFDLFFPKISPAAHNAIFDMERFLSLMAEDRVEPDNSNIDD